MWLYSWRGAPFGRFEDAKDPGKDPDHAGPMLWSACAARMPKKIQTGESHDLSSKHAVSLKPCGSPTAKLRSLVCPFEIKMYQAFVTQFGRHGDEHLRRHPLFAQA